MNIDGLEEFIQASAEASIQRIVESVKGIVASFEFYALVEANTDYDDNTYYVTEGGSIQGLALSKSVADAWCQRHNDEHALGEPALIITGDANYGSREMAVKKIDKDQWEITNLDVKDWCRKNNEDYANYCPAIFYCHPVEVMHD
jgi:hypothetical protein